MFLLLTGLALLLLGLFSGVVLVLAPLGFAPWSPVFTLWVLFPLFSVLGYVLFVIGAKTAHIRGLSLAVSSLLLLLAVVSAGGLVLSAASVFQPTGDTVSLWYVLAIAGVLGSIGAASHRPSSAEA